jgi:hypothetical protein
MLRHDATWLHKASSGDSEFHVEVEVSKDRASFAFFHLPTRTRRLAIIGKCMNTRVAGSKGALDDTLTLELQAS